MYRYSQTTPDRVHRSLASLVLFLRRISSLAGTSFPTAYKHKALVPDGVLRFTDVHYLLTACRLHIGFMTLASYSGKKDCKGLLVIRFHVITRAMRRTNESPIQPLLSSRIDVAFWKAALIADGGRQEAGDSVQVRSPPPCRIVSKMVWSL